MHTSIVKCMRESWIAYEYREMHTRIVNCIRVSRNAYENREMHTSMVKCMRESRNADEHREMHTSIAKCIRESWNAYENRELQAGEFYLPRLDFVLIAVGHCYFGTLYFLVFVAHWNGYEVRDFAEQSRLYYGCCDLFVVRLAGLINHSKYKTNFP